MREYKRKIDHEEIPIVFTDELETPIEINCAEISIENNKVQVKKLTRAQKKREQRKQKVKEKREMQKLKKEYEDR